MPTREEPWGAVLVCLQRKRRFRACNCCGSKGSALAQGHTHTYTHIQRERERALGPDLDAVVGVPASKGVDDEEVATRVEVVHRPLAVDQERPLRQLDVDWACTNKKRNRGKRKTRTNRERERQTERERKIRTATI